MGKQAIWRREEVERGLQEGREGREVGYAQNILYKRRTRKKKYREGEIPASQSFANATSLEQRCPLIPKRSSVYLQECLIKSENSV